MEPKYYGSLRRELLHADSAKNVDIYYNRRSGDQTRAEIRTENSVATLTLYHDLSSNSKSEDGLKAWAREAARKNGVINYDLVYKTIGSKERSKSDTRYYSDSDLRAIERRKKK